MSGKVTNEDILVAIQKLTSKQDNFQEDLSSIKECIIKQKAENENLQTKIVNLETENSELKQKLNILERNQKKNGFLIFGLAHSKDDNLLELVVNFIKEKLDSEFSKTDINYLFSLKNKKDKTAPIIVHLTSLIKKQDIFKNVFKLKNTGVALAHDLNKEERDNRKILLGKFKEAKKNNLETKLLGQKLIIEGIVYTAKELENKNLEELLVESADIVSSDEEEEDNRYKKTPEKENIQILNIKEATTSKEKQGQQDIGVNKGKQIETNNIKTRSNQRNKK